MKITRKTLSNLTFILIFCMLIGSLGWEVLERILVMFGVEWDLSIGPLGFDLHALALYVRINPGSVAGLAGGFLFFKSL